MVPAIASGDVPADKIAASSELKQLLDRDNVPWYRKRNLRLLYFTLVPAALGVEMTSGYDASVLNGLQAVQPWQDCKSVPILYNENTRVRTLTRKQTSITPKAPPWGSLVQLFRLVLLQLFHSCLASTASLVGRPPFCLDPSLLRLARSSKPPLPIVSSAQC